MSDWRAERVESAIRGCNPTVMAVLAASFAVIGDVQFLPGYTLALARRRGVDRLSDLPRAERLAFLADVDLIATAVENVCSRRDAGYRRLNIEILGNADAFLHCHIWPRYEWESSDLIGRPVWLYSAEHWSDPKHRLAARHDPLRHDLTAEVNRLRDAVEFGFNV